MTQPSATDSVRDLIARIAQLADEGDVEGYVALFAPDAVWTSPANPAVGTTGERRAGRDEIAYGARGRLARGIQGPGSATRHVITTTAVTHIDEATATAVSYWMFYRSTTTLPELSSMGRYDDTFRWLHGRWLLARRDITLG